MDETPTNQNQSAPKFGPANPPAKTLGSYRPDEANGTTDDIGDLQSAVSSILPGNLKQTPPSPSINILPQNTPRPAPSVVQNSPESGIKNMRTYEGDVAEIMSRKHVSTATIAIAENSKDTEGTGEIANGEPSHLAKNLLITLLCLILVGGGLFGAYYLYSLSPLKTVTSTPTPERETVPSLVPADIQTVISIDNLSATAIIAKIQGEIAKPMAGNTLKEIILIKTASGSAVRVTGPDVLNYMSIKAPDMLVRSLTAAWMLGVYSDENGEKSVFVVASENFFQNAFAGMLSWERVMADDLKLFLTPPLVMGIVNLPTDYNATTSNPLQNLNSILPILGTSSPSAVATTTSTPEASSSSQESASVKTYRTLRGGFQDRIIKNHDVREFITDNGQVLFLYSFIDDSKLAISGSEAALSEMLSRLEKQAFIR